ncbi:PSME3-interacting protein-like isoform X2 [Watersipora subatra]|uniref:PSME3-interacting protein-like isoform X2 n=1 Tax=Watersipora subatra TaxID=2589382 RepID=UPI00355C9CE2
MESNLPTFKKFISEDDIAVAKQKRQEEWERVRRPDQPEEAPEEEYDPRSLFERLEANRIKKQEEFDEAHRLKNMVKGLENDEIEFLEKVSRQKEQEEQDKDMEERLLLAEYKSSLVHDRTTEQEEEIQTIVKKPALVSPTQKQPKSQKQLLAGMIRKKSWDRSYQLLCLCENYEYSRTTTRHSWIFRQ